MEDAEYLPQGRVTVCDDVMRWYPQAHVTGSSIYICFYAMSSNCPSDSLI